MLDPIDFISVKKCFKCDLTKPLTDYYKHKQMADGHLNKCKSCSKSDVSKNYKENFDRYQEYEKNRNQLPNRVKAREDYAKTEEGILAGNKAKKKYTESNPTKRFAHNYVNNAVRDGKIIKPDSCEKCQEKASRINGHHDDYTKPIEVRWLCGKCHAEWHRNNIAICV